MDNLKYRQMLMLFSSLTGMVFILSYFFVFEIPSMLKSDGSWALIIMIPALGWLNWILITGFIKEWKYGFTISSKGEKN